MNSKAYYHVLFVLEDGSENGIGGSLKAHGAGYALGTAGVHIHAHGGGGISPPTARQRQLGYLGTHMAAKAGNHQFHDSISFGSAIVHPPPASRVLLSQWGRSPMRIANTTTRLE